MMFNGLTLKLIVLVFVLVLSIGNNSNVSFCALLKTVELRIPSLDSEEFTFLFFLILPQLLIMLITGLYKTFSLPDFAAVLGVLMKWFNFMVQNMLCLGVGILNQPYLFNV